MSLCVGNCFTTLGSGALGFSGSCGWTFAGLTVARFKICAKWMYAFVVGEPYVRVGMVCFGAFNMFRISVAACRR